MPEKRSLGCSAARAGSVDAVKVLAKAGADLNAKETWTGQTALMWAAAEGHAPVIETLLEFGADIHARSNAGTTPFMFAVRKGDRASVKAMLAAGADVNEKRTDLATPLLVAIINGYEDIVELLLDKGADPNAEGGSTELTVQGMRAQPRKIVLKTPSFHDQMRDVGSEGGNGRNNTFGKPLQAAVHVANWHISDEFISANVDRLRVIKSLVAHGADVNGRNTDMEPRWSGARYRHRLVGATAFLFAAKAGDVDAMRLLLKMGADPKINTGVNITPLMAAAGIAWASNQERASEEQVLEAVKLLVEECGADVNFVADTGETAMHAAAYRGANSVVQYLFDKGAKLDVVDKSGRTPLTIAEGVESIVMIRSRAQPADGRAAAQARREGNEPCPNCLKPELDPQRRHRTPVPPGGEEAGYQNDLDSRLACGCCRRWHVSSWRLPMTFRREVRREVRCCNRCRLQARHYGRRDRSGDSGCQPASLRCARQVLLHVPQRETEIGRTRAQHDRSGELGQES